jgi:hypothetical protein
MPTATEPLVLTTEERKELAIARQAGITCVVMNTATQLKHINCPWDEMQIRLIFIAFASLPLLAAILVPRPFVRWRHWVMGSFRVGFYLFPLMRRNVGVQKVLDDGVTPGKLGWLVDFYRVVWGEPPFALFCCRRIALSPACGVGCPFTTAPTILTPSIAHHLPCPAGTRLMAIVCCGLLSLPLPLGVHLLVQIFPVCMVLSNDTLCSSRLLRDGMHRVRAFDALMERAAAFTPLGTSVVGAAWLQGRSAGRVCSSFLTYVSVVVGVVVPTVAAARLPAFRTVPGFVRDVAEMRAGAGRAVRGMLMGDADPAGRRLVGRYTRSATRLMWWWFLLHGLWTLCVLAAGDVMC